MIPRLSLVAVLMCWSGVALAASFSGSWAGTVIREGQSLRLELDIPEQGVRASATLDLPDLAAYGIPVAITPTKNGIRVKRESSTPILLEGRLKGTILDGTFEGLGIVAPFKLRPSDPPPRIVEENVSFQNGETKLAGSILHPLGTALRPAIVCIHGSGAGDRSFAAYRSEGIFYARLGFAALIYDKRGTGASTGDFATSSMEDLAEDAIAGLRLLQTRTDIDAHHIGLTGISQGGWIVPLAATRSTDVAFIIVISAAGMNPMEQSIFHTANVLRQGGYSDDVVDRATDLRKRLYQIARTGTADPTLERELESTRSEPWFKTSSLPYPLPPEVSEGERRFLLFEPLPVWKRIRIPVLALWGGRDAQVPAANSRAIIEAALQEAGNPDHTLVVYPLADHNLRLVREKGDHSDFPRSVTGARLFISEWLRERLSLFRDPADQNRDWI